MITASFGGEDPRRQTTSGRCRVVSQSWERQRASSATVSDGWGDDLRWSTAALLSHFKRFYKGCIKKQTDLCQFGSNYESFKTNHTQLLLLSFIVKVGLPLWWSSRSLTLRNTGVIPSVHLPGLSLQSHRFFLSRTHARTHTLCCKCDTLRMEARDEDRAGVWRHCVGLERGQKFSHSSSAVIDLLLSDGNKTRLLWN